jgi:hypothetical protein
LRATMSQKSSVPQAISFVSQVLKRDSTAVLPGLECHRAVADRDAGAGNVSPTETCHPVEPTICGS